MRLVLMLLFLSLSMMDFLFVGMALPLDLCFKDSDCEPEECCLKRVSLIHGLCRKRPTEGERCYKTLFDVPTVTKSCSCVAGLSCKFHIPVVPEGKCVVDDEDKTELRSK